MFKLFWIWSIALLTTLYLAKATILTSYLNIFPKFFALPWLVVSKLQLKKTLKIAVYCTFLLGLANIAIAVLRYASFEIAAENSDVSISVLMLFNTLDCNLSLIIAFLPSLRQYFRSSGTSSQTKVQQVGAVSEKDGQAPQFTSITWNHRRTTSSFSTGPDDGKGSRRRISSVYDEYGHNGPSGNNGWGFRPSSSISVENATDAQEDKELAEQIKTGSF
ncbi:hypothetical protein G7Z17_g2761 [Cylindrodendrum hubeiense]|uniref:Rhodopsin domain-containing protein n=1 Tax=Cylindrodendrum hubeiense TaxID=595255 RepID=A0A9P5LE55_9HYPO|nr:hypothetical protein G7Z17_g2761 [Cylindrodendrum hubeiense]